MNPSNTSDNSNPSNTSPSNIPPQQNLSPNNNQFPANVPQSQNQGSGLGIAGFILVLVSILLFWLPFITSLLWLAGLILSLIAHSQAKSSNRNNNLAKAGWIIAIVSGTLYVILLIFGLFILEEEQYNIFEQQQDEILEEVRQEYEKSIGELELTNPSTDL